MSVSTQRRRIVYVADSVRQISRWAALTALDVATELIIVALPTWAISRVQVGTSKKRLVIFVFSFRLLVAGFSIAVLVSYLNFLRGSQAELDLVHTVVWQEVLIGCSLMSASIPCFRSFLWAFMSMGLQRADGGTSTTSGSHGNNRSYDMRSRRSHGGDETLARQSVNGDTLVRAKA